MSWKLHLLTVIDFQNICHLCWWLLPSLLLYSPIFKELPSWNSLALYCGKISFGYIKSIGKCDCSLYKLFNMNLVFWLDYILFGHDYFEVFLIINQLFRLKLVNPSERIISLKEINVTDKDTSIASIFWNITLGLKEI